MVFKSSRNSTAKGCSKSEDAKLNQMIKERAYYIWESKGKPKGQDLPIWIQAEKEIRARCRG